MSKFITTTNRNGACEVCGDQSGRCRRPQQGEIHLCMTYGDGRIGQIENGYKCIGNKNRGWATFKLDNAQDWTDQQRSNWQAHNALLRQQQQTEAETRKRRSLSAYERDRQYRQLLAELTLHPEDHSDLIERGFTNEEIKLCGFKSVEHYQQLQASYSKLLPGIGAGQTLTNYHAGYLCPVRNKDGLIVACQIRLRALPQGDKNRYRWLTSPKQGHVLHFFPKSSNPEGELPLAVQRPMGEPEGIALAEGIGAKPFLVSQRLNLLVIGAAGGQWASSSTTFRETLDSLEAELSGLKIIRLYPDAGDVQNHQVMHRWRRVIALLTKWGWTVQVGWWGQIEKSQPDIDELDDFNQIRYLSPAEFFTLDSSKSDRTTSEKDERAWELWRQARNFTPTRTLDEQFFDAPVPEPGSLTAVKSGLGTGKTEWLRRVVQALDDEGWIALGYRNSLLIQSSARWGFYHLHQDEAHRLLADPFLKVACCVDSLPHFEPNYFDNKNIILDEACSIISHLLFARTAVGRQRQECKAKFTEALRRAKRIFVLDGLLSDKDVAYLQQLIGEPRKVVKISNVYQGNAKKIFILKGASDSERVKVNDRSPLVNAIKTSRCCAIATDSQLEAEALDQVLTGMGKQVVRLDSKTSCQPWVSVFLNQPSDWLKFNQPEVFIFTPSAESGVDIPIVNYFEHFFCLFFGAVLTNAQQQMIGRIRDVNCPVFVYCRTTGIPGDKVSRATLPDQVAKVVEEFVIADGWATLSGIPHEQAFRQLSQRIMELAKNEHYDHECQLLALQNHEENNLRECLIAALTEAGHTLQEIVLETSNIDALHSAKDEAKGRNAQDIFNAETIAISEANNIASKTGLDWQTRCQIQKAKLLDRLPGIDRSEQWSAAFVRRVFYDDRDLLTRCELFFFVHHPDIAKQLQQSRWFNLLKAGQVDLAHHSSRYLKVKAMREIGLMQFLEPGFTWSKESPFVHTLYKRCQSSRQQQTHLGLMVRKLKPVDVVGRLLGKLGVPTTSELVSTETGRIRVYRVNTQALLDPDKVAIMEALDIRYRAFLEGTNERSNWAALFMGQEMPKIQLVQAVDTDHLTQVIYKNQKEGDQHLVSQSLGITPGSVAVATREDSPVDEIPTTLETIQDVAGMMNYCENSQMLAVVRCLPGMTRKLWQAAGQILSQQKRQELAKWMQQLFNSGYLQPSSA